MLRAARSFVVCVALHASLAAAQPAPEVLTFDEVVTRAIERNPQAQVAVEEIRRAVALLEQTRAAALPSLSVNGVYTRLEGNRVLNGSVIAPADQFNANLLLNVPLVSPSNWVKWLHARENIEVTQLSAVEVRRELAITAARTYLSILAQRHVVDVSERARANAEAHYSFAHQRFAGGFGTRVDEVRAAGELATDQANLEAAEAQLTRLRETLGVLVGLDHPVDATENVTLDETPRLEDGLREAETQRADVRLFKGRLHLAEKISRDSWTDYLPTLGLSAEPFYQAPPTSTTPQFGFQGQLGLSWFLYDGGLRYGLQHERQSLEREAKLNLENSQRQAAADVRAADDEVKRSTAALAAARNAAKLATDALDLTNLGYRAGASTNIEVIDAERAARDADTAVAAAEDAWRQALLDLLIATGRFPRRS